MFLSLVLLAILALIVLGFVLEPIIRARPDKVVIDSVDLPEPPPGIKRETEAGDPATPTSQPKTAATSEPQPGNSPAEGNT